MLGSILTEREVVRARTGAVRAAVGYTNMDHMSKSSELWSILEAISRLPSISVTNLGLKTFFQEIVYLK